MNRKHRRSARREQSNNEYKLGKRKVGLLYTRPWATPVKKKKKKITKLAKLDLFYRCIENSMRNEKLCNRIWGVAWILYEEVTR